MVKHELSTCHDSQEGEERGTVRMHSARQAQFATENVLTRFHSRGPRSPTPLAIAAFHRCKSTQRLPPRTTSGEGRGGQESKRETPPRQRDTAEVCNVAIFLSNRHRAILRLNIHGHDWELNKRKVVVYPIPTFRDGGFNGESKNSSPSN